MLLSPDSSKEELKNFDKSKLKKVYDNDDNVLFGSRYTKGKVSYNYIPGEFMTTGRPLIISSSISYDGKGNSDLSKDTIIMNFEDLKSMFPDNKFGN